MGHTWELFLTVLDNGLKNEKVVAIENFSVESSLRAYGWSHKTRMTQKRPSGAIPPRFNKNIIVGILFY